MGEAQDCVSGWLLTPGFQLVLSSVLTSPASFSKSVHSAKQGMQYHSLACDAQCSIAHMLPS